MVIQLWLTLESYVAAASQVWRPDFLCSQATQVKEGGDPYEFQQESDLYYMAAYAGYKYIG